MIFRRWSSSFIGFFFSWQFGERKNYSIVRDWRQIKMVFSTKKKHWTIRKDNFDIIGFFFVHHLLFLNFSWWFRFGCCCFLFHLFLADFNMENKNMEIFFFIIYFIASDILNSNVCVCVFSTNERKKNRKRSMAIFTQTFHFVKMKIKTNLCQDYKIIIFF